MTGPVCAQVNVAHQFERYRIRRGHLDGRALEPTVISRCQVFYSDVRVDMVCVGLYYDQKLRFGIMVDVQLVQQD